MNAQPSSTGQRTEADTGVERASRLLRDGILRGRLPQGQRLSEVRLAKEFGLSRGPIREALRGLEREGLIIAVPNRATFVCRVTPIQVLEALEVRALLEPAAYEAALQHRGHGLGVRLAGVVRDMEARLAAGELSALAALHGRFHTIIYQEAPNRHFRIMWQQIEWIIELHALTVVASRAEADKLVAEHAQLASVLGEGDVVAGRQAITEHLTSGAVMLKIPYYDGDLGRILQEG